MKVHMRVLNDTDFASMRSLLLSDGPNEWNYLTEESVDHQFYLIKQGKAFAVIAEANDIVGFAVIIFREACPEKLEKYSSRKQLAYINDVVVSQAHSGKGIGRELLLTAVSLARKEGCDAVYIERHENNAASAGMMNKAGFDAVDTFYDPSKRSVGSRKTTVMCKST